MGNTCACLPAGGDSHEAQIKYSEPVEFRPLNSNRNMQTYVEIVIKIQTNIRGYLARKKYQVLKRSAQVNAFQPHLLYQGNINDLNFAPFEP